MYPKADALNSALNCVFKISVLSRQTLIALQPRKGFSSFGSCIYGRDLSPPISIVLIVTGFPSILSATVLYASNCSSSVGNLSLFINKNSVLYNPIPVAPFLKTPSTSFGDPIFAQVPTLVPSSDIASLSFNCFKSSFSAKKLFLFSSYFPISSSVGLIIISPFKASTITVSPLFTREQIFPVPTIAGSSRDLAIIEECAVFPPTSVINATTLFKSIWAVSEGVKSFAAIIVFAGSELKSIISIPTVL